MKVVWLNEERIDKRGNIQDKDMLVGFFNEERWTKIMEGSKAKGILIGNL